MSMKKMLLMTALLFISFNFAQELQQEEYVHGPLNYYVHSFAKLSSLVVPPAWGIYQLLSCQEATCLNPMAFGIAGLTWATVILCVHKFDNCHPMQKEKAECTVSEFASLIGRLPEVVDNLSMINKNRFVNCPENNITTCKLSFTIHELEKMFGGYDTYYGLDSNKKPVGQLEVDNERISHSLITAWAINQYYWKQW